jgi:hypothetical protein
MAISALSPKDARPRADKGKSSIAKLSKLINKLSPRFSLTAIIGYVYLFSLNAIPVIGTAAFVVVQGKWGLH